MPTGLPESHPQGGLEGPQPLHGNRDGGVHVGAGAVSAGFPAPAGTVPDPGAARKIREGFHGAAPSRRRNPAIPFPEGEVSEGEKFPLRQAGQAAPLPLRQAGQAATRLIVWSPQERQAAFMARPEYEALYGGAAGGGKTQALVAEALRQVNVPHYRAILFRKTYRELLEIRDIALDVYGRSFPRAKYNGSEHCWTFPSGARIYFGNMQYTSDRAKYQGQAYDYVAFDELTHFLAEEYMYMYSRCRPHGPGTRCYVRAATNPGGVGHGWVKDRFVAPAPPMTTIRYDAEVIAPGGEKLVIPRTRVFVPSTVFDNARLLENSPEYLANLAMLPEAERQALLYGSWDSFSGQVFVEWRDDPSHYRDRRYTHVIEPFELPAHWRIYRGFDFGYAKPYSVGWYAADPDGRIYRVAELYGLGGAPNVGTREHPGEIARRIREMEEGNPFLRGRRVIGIADPAIFDESRGESVAAMMARAPNLILFDRGDNARIAGKMQMHYRLQFRDDGRPMLQVFNGCRNFIRTIPTLVYDRHTVEDIDTDGEDHIYDECRYVMMERPIAPPPPAKRREVSEFDPLDTARGAVRRGNFSPSETSPYGG